MRVPPNMEGHLQNLPKLALIEEPFPPQNLGPQSPTPKDQLTEWGKLAYGKTIGKSAVVQFTFTAGLSIPAPVNCLELRGDDDKALQLSLLVTPPKLMPTGTIIPTGADPQASQGPFYDNADGQNAAGVVPSFGLPFAEITWGVGGVLTRAEVDISNGCLVNLSGSFLRVRVGVDEPGFDPGSRIYQLAAMVSPGSPRPNNACRTVPAGFLAAAAPSNVLPVPAFARRWWVVCGDNTSNITMDFFGNAAGTLGAGSFSVPAGSNPNPLPIPAGAYYFTIQGSSLAVPFYWAVFDLGI